MDTDVVSNKLIDVARTAPTQDKAAPVLCSTDAENRRGVSSGGYIVRVGASLETVLSYLFDMRLFTTLLH